MIMTQEEKAKLQDVLFLLDAMGCSNAFVRNYFDTPLKKDWAKFMKEYHKILSNKK